MMRRTTRQAWAILGVAAALSLAWAWVSGRPGMPADFAEYNEAANRIRIEGYLARASAPSNVIVGSSLSGRLLASYFDGTRLGDVGNLGLDGSGPMVGIEVMLRRKDLPERVWVETYLMGRAETANDRALKEGLGSTGTRLAVACPLFRASHRPSSVTYSALKRRREGRGEGHTWTNHAAAGVAAAPVDPAPVDAGVEERWREILRDLARRQVHVTFVDMPSGETTRPGPRRGLDLADRLQMEFKLDRVDLREAWFRRGWVPRYTDGRHLDAASARTTASMLAEMAGP